MDYTSHPPPADDGHPIASIVCLAGMIISYFVVKSYNARDSAAKVEQTLVELQTSYARELENQRQRSVQEEKKFVDALAQCRKRIDDIERAGEGVL
jgi:cell division protein FtsB